MDSSNASICFCCSFCLAFDRSLTLRSEDSAPSLALDFFVVVELHSSSDFLFLASGESATAKNLDVLGWIDSWGSEIELSAANNA